MADIINTLGFLGWIMGVVGIVALWVNRGMRKELEKERARQRKAESSGGDNGAA